MFAGAPVDVIHTAFEISVIANGVFPIALLPDAAQTMSRAGFGLWCLAAARTRLARCQSQPPAMIPGINLDRRWRVLRTAVDSEFGLPPAPFHAQYRSGVVT